MLNTDVDKLMIIKMLVKSPSLMLWPNIAYGFFFKECSILIVDWSLLNNAFIYPWWKPLTGINKKHKTCLVIKKKPTLKSSVILITNANELQCPWPSKIHIISEHNHYAAIFIYFKTLFLKTKALKYQEIIPFRMRFLKKTQLKMHKSIFHWHMQTTKYVFIWRIHFLYLKG